MPPRKSAASKSPAPRKAAASAVSSEGTPAKAAAVATPAKAAAGGAKAQKAAQLVDFSYLLSHPLDMVYFVFYIINIVFITPIVDGEQLINPTPIPTSVAAAFATGAGDPSYAFPRFFPQAFVKMNMWWGHHYDPLQLARPFWWKATIVWDVTFFFAFYIYAVWVLSHPARAKAEQGRYRIISLIYGCVIATIVSIICTEETWGPHAARNWPVVMLANLPWFALPAYNVYRMATNEKPFGL